MQIKKISAKTGGIHGKIKICCSSGRKELLWIDEHTNDDVNQAKTSKNGSSQTLSLGMLSDSSNSPSSSASVSSFPLHQQVEAEFLELEKRLNFLANLHTARSFFVAVLIHFAIVAGNQSPNLLQQQKANVNKVFDAQKYVELLTRLDSVAHEKLDEFNALYCAFSSSSLSVKYIFQIFYIFQI